MTELESLIFQTLRSDLMVFQLAIAIITMLWEFDFLCHTSPNSAKSEHHAREEANVPIPIIIVKLGCNLVTAMDNIAIT